MKNSLFLISFISFSISASPVHLQDQIDPKFEQYEGGSHQSEQKIFDILIEDSKVMLKEMEEKLKIAGKEKITRDAHAKSHGCLEAKFTVNNNNLDDKHKLGIFSEDKKEYKAILRFSNNDEKHSRSDNEPDLRGVAIKLLGVEGDKVMKGKEFAQTQDFLMYGSKRFFIKNNADYVGFIKGLRHGTGAKSLFFGIKEEKIDPKTGKKIEIKYKGQPKAGIQTRLAQGKNYKKYINPLEGQYFSATPVRLGELDNPNRTAFKYGVYPCDGFPITNLLQKEDDKNYMRKNLEYSLKKHKKACFEFRVQLQKDSKAMPIEDASVQWPETAPKLKPWSKKFSPYITVATINIDYNQNKDISSDQARDRCENFSFNPWHTLTAHKPLGRTMRMRRDVYREISDFRREENGVSLEEPTRK